MLWNGFRYIRDADDISATLSFPFIGGLNEATGELNRVFAEQAIVNKTFALQTNLVGEFNTGPIGHAVLFGIDWARYELESDSFTDFSLRAPINIFDPVYGAVARPDRPDTPFSGETINTDSLRVYVQDQIKLLKGLSLVAGLSYETLDQRTIAFPSETECIISGGVNVKPPFLRHISVTLKSQISKASEQRIACKDQNMSRVSRNKIIGL